MKYDIYSYLSSLNNVDIDECVDTVDEARSIVQVQLEDAFGIEVNSMIDPFRVLMIVEDVVKYAVNCQSAIDRTLELLNDLHGFGEIGDSLYHDLFDSLTKPSKQQDTINM